MKTGNTCASTDPAIWHEHASMEPGHEDREYTSQAGSAPTASSPQWSPVMKTGNTSPDHPGIHTAYSLNGARS